jgi:O-antigen/teichoic acid export membrane protein
MFAERILRMLVGLLVGIWVARFLGPAQFGVFSYAIAFAALFGSLATLGLDSIVIRDLVRSDVQLDLCMGTAFWLKLLGSMLMLIAMLLAIRLTSNDSTTNLYIFIIGSGTLFQSFEVIDFYFQSQVLSKFVSFCRLTQLLISSLLKLYFILAEAELIWFVVVSLIDQVTLAISLYFAFRYQKTGVSLRRFDLGTAKRLLRESWPLVISGLVVTVYMRIDQVMIKQMLGDEQVGLYSAAVRLSEGWYFVPVIITNSLFPAVVRAKEISLKLYNLRLRRLYTFVVWMAIAFALPMTFLSDWLVVTLYGEAFRAAGQVLMVHVWAGVFVALGVASGSWFISENLQRLAFYRTFLGATINIGLNLLLIPALGLLGAAVATIISQSMAAFFFDLLTRRTRMVFFMKLKTLGFSNLN